LATTTCNVNRKIGKAAVLYARDTSRQKEIGNPAHIILTDRWHSVVKKATFSLEHAMKAQRGSRGIAILFL
jgi:hypothetical protein